MANPAGRHHSPMLNLGDWKLQFTVIFILPVILRHIFLVREFNGKTVTMLESHNSLPNRTHIKKCSPLNHQKYVSNNQVYI